jgi:hypothetical protein
MIILKTDLLKHYKAEQIKINQQLHLYNLKMIVF